MKKMSIWMFVVFFVLQCCISGCTQFDDSSSGTLGEASTSTTTHTSIVDEETSTTTSTDQATENTINSSFITSTQTTSQEPPICDGTVAFEEFKSVEELLYWIHNGKGIASFFRGAIQGLKLDHLLIIEAADDTFTLEYIRTFQRGSGWDAQIEYYFISEKGERVWFIVQLGDMRASVDDVEIYVNSTNLDNDYSNHFKFTYRDITVNTEDATVQSVADEQLKETS